MLNTSSKRWFALVSVLLALGCGSKGTLPDGGPSGAGGAGGGNKAGGGAGGSSADAGPAIPLTLESARMRTAGRFGTDLRFEVSAQSYAADAVGLGVRFLTAAAAPALVFDRNSDGVPDSAETLVAFDGMGPFKKSFTAAGTLKQFIALHPAVSSAEVWLLNALGEKTFVTKVSLEPQAMSALGMPCDRAYVDNRCANGLGCKGTPPTCRDGVAPVISRVSYLRSADGPRVLLEGLDPDDDVSEVKLDFQDRMGHPVSVDLDNDGLPDSTSQTYPVLDVSSDGGYFYGIQAGPGFEALVPRIGAVVSDIGTRPSTTVTSDIADAPVKSSGASCDLRGFNVCAPASVCQRAATAPNAITGSCQAVSTVRKSRCTAAPVLGPVTGRWTAVGSTVSPSVFDAPAGCTNNDPKGRPEGVALLRLTAPAATVVLSTEHPGTSFDTVLYVFKGCGDQGPALDCNDEGMVPPASTLTLTNLAAGDYLVVVDSWDPTGGSYELSVELK